MCIPVSLLCVCYITAWRARLHRLHKPHLIQPGLTSTSFWLLGSSYTASLSCLRWTRGRFPNCFLTRMNDRNLLAPTTLIMIPVDRLDLWKIRRKGLDNRHCVDSFVAFHFFLYPHMKTNGKCFSFGWRLLVIGSLLLGNLWICVNRAWLEVHMLRRLFIMLRKNMPFGFFMLCVLPLYEEKHL